MTNPAEHESGSHVPPTYVPFEHTVAPLAEKYPVDSLRSQANAHDAPEVVDEHDVLDSFMFEMWVGLLAQSVSHVGSGVTNSPRTHVATPDGEYPPAQLNAQVD